VAAVTIKPIVTSGIIVSECGVSLVMFGQTGNPIISLGILLMFLGATPILLGMLEGACR